MEKFFPFPRGNTPHRENTPVPEHAINILLAVHADIQQESPHGYERARKYGDAICNHLESAYVTTVHDVYGALLALKRRQFDMVIINTILKLRIPSDYRPNERAKDAALYAVQRDPQGLFPSAGQLLPESHGLALALFIHSNSPEVPLALIAERKDDRFIKAIQEQIPTCHIFPATPEGVGQQTKNVIGRRTSAVIRLPHTSLLR